MLGGATIASGRNQSYVCMLSTIYILGPTLDSVSVSGVRCPVSGVTIEVLRMYAEHNHILGPTLDSVWHNHIYLAQPYEVPH
jgi:hypothetical protein